MAKKYTCPEDYLEAFLNSKMAQDILEGSVYLEPVEQIYFCDTIKLLLHHNKRPANGWYKRIANFKKYNVPSSTWKERVNDILGIMETQGSIPMTQRTQILLYGSREGALRWGEYLRKQALTNTFEYKKEKYGWTREQFDEYNKSRAVTIENLIERHGEEEGLRQWMKYCDRQAYTNTLDYFIEREGSKEKGLEVYKNINVEKSKSMNPMWIVEKYNVDFDEALEILSSIRTPSFISEGEKYFIDLLEKELGEQIKYTYKTKQFCVWSTELHIPFFYDAVCTQRKKVIEYNGDYWHANPLLYESSTVIKQKDMTAKEIWDRDQTKIKAITDRGFEVKVIWESEFLKNENLIKEVVKWMSIA